MAESTIPLDITPRPVTPSSAQRLAGLMPKMAASLGIKVEDAITKDDHFWYLVGRNYATQSKRIPQTLGEMTKLPKDLVRNLALANSIEQSKERFFLEKEAATDKLTGVFNRRALDAYLKNILAHRRSGIGDVFVMMDIDDFKKINDTYGHLVGDVALQSLVTIIGSNKRGVDFLARYGGEEFAILMPGVEMTDGWREAMINRVDLFRQNIQKELREHIERLTGVKLEKDLTASFGVAFINGIDGTPSIDALYATADSHLYTAKHTGKNKVVSEVSTSKA